MTLRVVLSKSRGARVVVWVGQGEGSLVRWRCGGVGGLRGGRRKGRVRGCCVGGGWVCGLGGGWWVCVVMVLVGGVRWVVFWLLGRMGRGCCWRGGDGRCFEKRDAACDGCFVSGMSICSEGREEVESDEGSSLMRQRRGSP